MKKRVPDKYKYLFESPKPFSECSLKEKAVYAYFDNMRHGTRLRLTAYQGRKLEWVLLTYVAFYFEGAHWLEFFISDDYNTIVRRNIAPEDFDREVEQWLNWKKEHQH